MDTLFVSLKKSHKFMNLDHDLTDQLNWGINDEKAVILR